MSESEQPAAPAVSSPQQPPQDNTQALAVVAAQLASLHATREPLKQALEILDKEIERIATQAHQAMANAGIRTMTIAQGTLALKPKLVFVPTDWSALHAYIQTTGEFELLHRRLHTTALRERKDNLPPGVISNVFDVFEFTPK